MALGQFIGSVVFANETTKDVDVSASIQDARNSVPALYDGSGNVVAISIQALNATTFRLTSGLPLTDTYKFVVVGTAPIPDTPTPPATGSISGPNLNPLWTYCQAREKLEEDLDLLDETSVKPNELINYFNEGIEEAESEVLKLDEDYFLTSMPVPVVQGQSSYDYPPNCYAYKVRGLMYTNGTLIYEIIRFTRYRKFPKIHFALQYTNSTDDYQWYHTNDTPGAPKLNLVPPARETAIVPPVPQGQTAFTPVILWYIRHANRVPRLGQYIRNWSVLDSASTADPTNDWILTTAAFITGDKVQLTSTGTLPGGLTAGTTYYVIANTGNIQLATTLANAKAGTYINLTNAGLGILSIALAANQSIIDNTILDLPEFIKFVIQWAKCRCLEKMGDPRLSGAVDILAQQREQLVSTFSEMQQDDQTEITPDFSSYNEMS